MNGYDRSNKAKVDAPSLPARVTPLNRALRDVNDIKSESAAFYSDHVAVGPVRKRSRSDEVTADRSTREVEQQQQHQQLQIELTQREQLLKQAQLEAKEQNQQETQAQLDHTQREQLQTQLQLMQREQNVRQREQQLQQRGLLLQEQEQLLTQREAAWNNGICGFGSQ